MTAVDISVTDQVEELTLSKVASGLRWRYWIRIMEMAQVCDGVSGVRRRVIELQ